MKRFRLARQILGFIVIGLGLFAVLKYTVIPKLTAMSLCKPQEACLHGLTLSDDGAHTLKYSADGKYLFGIGVDGGRSWSVQNAYSSKRLGTPYPRSLALASDGRYAVAKRNGEVSLFDASGKEILEFSTMSQGLSSITHIVFTPGFDMLATPARNSLFFWSTRDGSFVTTLPHESSIASLAASEQGSVAAGQYDGRIVLWPIKDFSAYSIIKASEATISELAFQANGQILASGDAEGQVNLWDIATGTVVKSFKESDSLVTGISFSQDSRLLAVAHASGLVVLWNSKTGELLESWQYARKINSLALSPDGHQLALALREKAQIVQAKRSGATNNQLERNFLNTLNDTYVQVNPGVILIRDISKFVD